MRCRRQATLVFHRFSFNRSAKMMESCASVWFQLCTGLFHLAQIFSCTRKSSFMSASALLRVTPLAIGIVWNNRNSENWSWLLSHWALVVAGDNTHNGDSEWNTNKGEGGIAVTLGFEHSCLLDLSCKHKTAPEQLTNTTDSKRLYRRTHKFGLYWFMKKINSNTTPIIIL